MSKTLYVALKLKSHHIMPADIGFFVGALSVIRLFIQFWMDQTKLKTKFTPWLKSGTTSTIIGNSM